MSCVFSCSGVSAYQQFPRSPCRMSEGLGVRNTDHLTPRSLKLLQLISWGRSHFLIRCWTLSPSGKPTDRGPGGKLSSTKFTEFWERGGKDRVKEGRETKEWHYWTWKLLSMKTTEHENTSSVNSKIHFKIWSLLKGSCVRTWSISNC